MFPRLRARISAGALSLIAISCASAPSHSAFEVGAPTLDGFPLSSERYSIEDVNGSFPDTITIKTRTQSFNSYHYYLIHDGLIWFKGLSHATGPGKWTLLLETGLPHNIKKNGFHLPRRIVEISADGNELSALSDEGWFYRIVFDKKSSLRKPFWEDTHGWPTPSPLKFNGFASTNRGWAASKRNADVRYYEDIFGNQHHYGTAGVMTNYVLLADGQEIRFADPGLPSDFSRTIIGPERGAFVAENIAASASTIFLIGAAGEMYTRLADFDTIGCNPMFFRYTYKPYVSTIPGTKYSSILEPWALPGEDWRAQPRIPLRSRAAISRRIAIVQNGMGNAARELRVAGYDEEGQVGYWSKSIFGDTWSFVRHPLVLSGDDLLHPDAFVDGKGPRGPIADRRYSGSLWKDGLAVPGLRFEIPDFNILEGSCRLVIRRGEESASIIFHPIEAWTYVRRVSPGRDGTPKVYLATIEIQEDAFKGLSDEFRAELKRSILSSDRELFRYFVEATADYLLIEPRDPSKSAYTLFLTPSGDATYNPETFRVTQAAELGKCDRYASEELSMPSGGPFIRADLEALKKRIAANEKLAAEITARIKAFTTTQRRADVSRFAYSTLNLFSHVTLLYRNRYVYIITRHGGALLARNNELLDLVSETRIWFDGLFLELIEKRIQAYSNVARSLEAGAALVYLPKGYAESYLGYMAAAGLPQQLEGRFVPGPQAERFPEAAEDGTIPARLRPIPMEQDFPGWLLEVGDEPAFSLLVELEGAARKIYERNGISAFKKPLTIRVRLHLVSTGTAERDRDLYRKTLGDATISEGGVRGTLSWDGSTLVIKRIADSSAELLYRGLLPAPQP
jgi:hypothetical protein